MTQNPYRLWILAFAIWLAHGPAPAQDAIRIDSVGSADSRIPIAIPPFATGGGTRSVSKDLTAVISGDLNFTGLFSIVAKDQYPKGFRGLPTDAAKINFESWRATPAEHLVFALLRQQGADFVAECRLLDVLVSKQIVGKRLRTEARWSRLLGHQFADDIVHFLTGVAGIASTEICFSAGDSGHKEIYVADYDGATITKITNHGSISIRPKISPDGMRIAYLSYKDNFPFLYVYDRRTGTSTPLSRRVGLNHAPAWAPDGKSLALCLSKDGNTEIYTKKVDGTEERRLTTNRVSDTSPSFSPDGRRIAFVSDRSGRPQIFVMNRNGGDVQRLSYQGGSAYDPAWSPDGKKVAYVVEKSGDGFEIYLMNHDGSNPERITDSAGSNESPSWSPDGRHIVFGSTRTGVTRLFTVTLETGQVRPIPGLSHLLCQGPSWGPRRK